MYYVKFLQNICTCCNLISKDIRTDFDIVTKNTAAELDFVYNTANLEGRYAKIIFHAF